MRLTDAKLCPDCDEVFGEEACPNCTNRSFLKLSKILKVGIRPVPKTERKWEGLIANVRVVNR